MIKAIIFDLFGTLTPGRGDPEKQIIKRFHLKKDYKFVERFVCGHKFRNTQEYLDSIIKGLCLPDNNMTRSALKDILSSEVAKEKILPGRLAVVRQLKKQGYLLALISNAASPQYDLIRKNKISEFDVITYSYVEGITKPDLRIFKRTISRLKVAPEETVMIGNSLKSDILPARKIGMKTVHFTNLGDLKKELKKKLKNF